MGWDEMTLIGMRIVDVFGRFGICLLDLLVLCLLEAGLTDDDKGKKGCQYMRNLSWKLLRLHKELIDHQQ